MDNGSVLLQRVKRVLMRLFQYLMALGKYFIPYGGPELRSWPGKIRRLGQFLKDKKIDRLLLVTGESLMQNGVIRPALDSLDEAGIDYSVLTFDSPITTDQDVEEGYQVYVDRGREAILAIGGGTRIDCAKAIAARVARPELPAAAIAGYMRVRRRIPALVVIPTSAGTGSEASIEAVVKDSVSQKNMTIHDINLIPRYVLLDPELLRTLPR